MKTFECCSACIEEKEMGIDNPCECCCRHDPDNSEEEEKARDILLSYQNYRLLKQITFGLKMADRERFLRENLPYIGKMSV